MNGSEKTFLEKKKKLPFKTNKESIMEEVPTQLRDPALILSPDTYSLCLLVRLLLGTWICLSESRFTALCSCLLSAFVVLGLMRKSKTNPSSWKNYRRAIMIYSMCFLLAYANLADLAYPSRLSMMNGTLVIFDALMGQQSKYIATTYGKK